MLNSTHIVLAAANPRETAQLQLDAEVQRIETQLAQSAYIAGLAGSGEKRVNIQLRAVWAAQFIDLVTNVTAFQPSVVQFSGHGEGKQGLVLAGEDNRLMLVPGKLLRQVLGEFAATTRLVLLNACYSAEQAEEIKQVIDCVIGMKDGISDQGAAVFAAALYGQLALGSSVGRSFRLANAIMTAHSPSDADIPSLQCRAGVDPDKIFVTSAKKEPTKNDTPWKVLLESSELSFGVLRRAFNLALPKDVELEAFVQDRRHDPRYARVHGEWGADMQRQRKLNLLFDYGPEPGEMKADLIDFVG